MARSTPSKPAKGGKPAVPPKPLTRRQRLTRLLAALALLALIAIGAAGYLYMARLQRGDGGGRLTVSKDFGTEAQKPAAAPAAQPGAARDAERTHTVKAGENLWSIASKGDLVGNAWEWRTILVQNRDKIQYAFLSEEDGGWKVMVEEGQQLTVKGGDAPSPLEGTGKPEREYAVQMLTVPEQGLTRAVGIVKQLIADGHFAYLYRREADGKRFYRIRVGFFATPADAALVGEDLIAKYTAQKLFKDYWVMRPSDVELQGGHLDYGAQQARPWVVELPQRGSHQEALEDLRKIAGASEFAYIAQKRDDATTPAHYLYRTRIGFFESEGQAKDFIAAHKDAAAILAEGQALQVESFQEALPGQNLRLGKPAAG